MNTTWRGDCRGKVRYRSKRLAQGACRVLQQAGRARGELHAYRCTQCRYWHLGNISVSEKPAPLKTIRAAVGDTVEIIWRALDGTVTRTRHEAPK